MHVRGCVQNYTELAVAPPLGVDTCILHEHCELPIIKLEMTLDKIEVCYYSFQPLPSQRSINIFIINSHKLATACV